MTIRDLPEIKPFDTSAVIDWEMPVKADGLYTPVKAAHDDARSINIFGNIGAPDGANDVYISEALDNLGAGPLTVNINSRGGDFFTGVSIYNQLRQHDGPVTVRVLGLAASAGSMIAMASDNLQIAKSGFLMIHNSHGVVMGGADALESAAGLFRQFDAAMAGVYADRSGVAMEQVVKWMDAEMFFSGAAAVKNGLADALLADDDIVPSNDKSNPPPERRAEMAMRQGGMSSRDSKTLVAQLKAAGRDVALYHTKRDAGADGIAEALRSLTDKISA